MSEKAPKRVRAGFESLEGGMDSGQAPQLIESNQVAFAWNATVRGGFVRPRPGWNKRVLNFHSSEDTRIAFEESGRWQHGGYYQPDKAGESLMAVIGGRIFKINVLDDFSVQEITIPGDPNSSQIDQGWSEQLEMFWVFNDGQSAPFVHDGAKSRRTGAGEIRAGSVMKFTKGRLWYATPDGFGFRASDITRGGSGTAQYKKRDAALKETENTFLNEGGDFAVPANSGGIKAMRELAELDKSLGQGPLQVLTSNTVFSVDAPVERDLWKDVTYPIQTESFIGAGGQSQLSTINVNGDLFFRDKNAQIRSLVLARREYNKWSNTPQSSEVSRVLANDTRAYNRFASGVEFDNRMLQTFGPTYTDHGVYHQGLVVLDFDLLTSLRKKSDPAWEAAWFGLKILQIIKGDFDGLERCFMFVLSKEDKIELWEQSLDDHADNGGKRITWGLEGGRWAFESGRTQLKRLDGGHFFLNDIEGQVDYEVRYKPDNYPFWIFWAAGQKCVPQCERDPLGCLTLEKFNPGYEPKIGLTEPDDTCNTVTGKMHRDLFEAQIRFQFTGFAMLTQCVLYATDQVMRPFGDCQPAQAICEPITGCDISPYDYSAEA